MIAGFYWGNEQDVPAVTQLWEAAGLNTINMGSVAGKQLLLAPKILIETTLVVTSAEWKATAVGVFIYKGFVAEEAVRLALTDLEHHRFDELAVRGTFAFLVYNEEHLKIWLDATVIQHLYVNKAQKALSTSFLALVETQSNRTPQLESFQELLLTGTQIGPETLVKGIFKTEPHYIPEIAGVEIKICKRPTQGSDYKSREEALDHAQAHLEACFNDYRGLATAHGALLGLTGGLDSRLNLAVALKKWPKPIEVYTNCRIRKGKEQVIDEPLAQKAAESVGLTLRAGWMVHPLDMDDVQLAEVMEQSYQFFDGHGRMHAQWFEDYNTARFKKALMGNRLFGLSGIGGEQYRNFEGMLTPTWSRDYFIRYHLALNYCGPVFKNQQAEDSFADSLGERVWSKIKPAKSDRVSHSEVKQYLNEILISNRLGARNNAENRLAWFASPFTDPGVSIPAYGLTKWLGSSIEFEKDLIVRLNDSLANVPLDYGIRPKDDLSLKMKIKPWVRHFTPSRLWVDKRIGPLSEPGSYQLFNELSAQSTLIKTCVEEVNKLSLPIHLNRLCALPDFMPIVVNMGYFLLKLKQPSLSTRVKYE